MPARLVWNGYGKAAVRLVKVDRGGPSPRIHDLTVETQLQGDFERAHVAGDNADVLPTDTMKNTVYAFARQGPVAPPEDFAARLGRRLLEACPAARRAVVTIAVQTWVGHDDAFVRGGPERRLATVTIEGAAVHAEAGLDRLGLLKASGSAFAGFRRDEFTTLRDTDDRILATDVAASWSYPRLPEDYDAAWGAVRTALLDAFASHRSASVQHTLFAMGESALARCADIDRIRLILPNRHHLPVDLSPFGLDNPNEVFVVSTEPHGRIEAVVAREAEPGAERRAPK
jgi:urate oxidase